MSANTYIRPTMKNNFTATAQIDIQASAAAVWDTLTNPEKIRHWLFGTETTCDWKKGSPITYTGEYRGKPYLDKGTILEIDPPKLLVMDYWSSFAGLADIPENYQKITYQLAEVSGAVRLTVVQQNHRSEEARSNSEGHWQQALAAFRQVAES